MIQDKYKLGIAPINWSNDDDPHLGGDISFEQCIKEMSECGYIGCEIGSKFPKDAHILKSKLEPLNLQVTSAWYSTYFTEDGKYRSTLSNYLDHLSLLNNLGAKYINIAECGHSIQGLQQAIKGDHKPVFTPKQWDLLIQGLHQLGRIAYDYNMTIVYHFHMGTGVQNREEIDFLMKHTCPDLVSLLLDTGHAYFANIDPFDLMNAYADRIKYIHLKDVRSDILDLVQKQNLCFMDSVRQGIFTVPGDGCLDFQKIFKALNDNNYDGWLIVEAEQDPEKADPKIYAKSARKFITECMRYSI